MIQWDDEITLDLSNNSKGPSTPTFIHCNQIESDQAFAEIRSSWLCRHRWTRTKLISLRCGAVVSCCNVSAHSSISTKCRTYWTAQRRSTKRRPGTAMRTRWMIWSRRKSQRFICTSTLCRMVRETSYLMNNVYGGYFIVLMTADSVPWTKSICGRWASSCYWSRTLWRSVQCKWPSVFSKL